MVVRKLCLIFFYVLSFGICFCIESDSEQAVLLEKSINDIVKVAKEYNFPVDASSYKPTNPHQNKYFGTFDFIIIGGGTTGSVVANRLSEEKKWKILLLEAGNYSNDISDIPAMGRVLQSTNLNWGFYSVPQKYGCFGTEGQKCPHPRGKVIGGTSIFNGMAMTRGNPLDYNKWASLGNPGWSYREVLPYFLKYEDFHQINSQAPVDWKYHHIGGELPVQHSVASNSRTQAFIEAHLELGYNLSDFNSPKEVGVSPLQFNQKRGSRYDTGRAFIKPIRQRKNLQIMTNSYVTKLNFAIFTKRVSDVEFAYNNKRYFARAKKDVILSAGAIQTPQLLMLSGIGPRKHLRDLGITPKRDLEVGSNLRDHNQCTFYINHNSKDDLTSTLSKEVKDYLNGTGKLTSLAGMSVVSFVPSRFETNKDYPDLEKVILANANSVPDLGNNIVRFTKDTLEGIKHATASNSTVGLNLYNLHTKSIGTVRLKSNDPFTYPLIDPKIFSVQEDLERLYEGILQLQKLLQTEAFKKLNASIAPFNFKACGSHNESSKDYWFCVLKQLTIIAYHPVGSCPMGPDPKSGAVVDVDLKVHGIDNLRIADASIIPFPISGHPMSTCIMIGEKISKIIKERFKYNVK